VVSACNDEEEEDKRSLEGLGSQQDYEEGAKFNDVGSNDSSFEMYDTLNPKKEEAPTPEMSTGSLKGYTASMFSPL
jgi:hypothetical protein